MTFNTFRALGDWLHLMARFMVLHRVLIVKNAQGVSRRTQEMYLLVFVCRYLDLLTTFYSFYNSVMKCIYIVSTATLVTVLSKWSNHSARMTYRSEEDNFNYWLYAVLPCSVLSVISWSFGTSRPFMHWDVMELLWTFSIYLEALATLPQIFMFRKYRQVENLTGGSFIVMVGMYRLMYILNWIYRAHMERHYVHHYVVYSCGVVQVLLAFTGIFCWPSSFFSLSSSSSTSSSADDNASSDVAQQNDERPSAPLLPQLLKFYRGSCSTPSSAFFCLATFVLMVVVPFLPEAAGPPTEFASEWSTAAAVVAALGSFTILLGIPFLCILCYLLRKPTTKSSSAEDDGDIEATAASGHDGEGSGGANQEATDAHSLLEGGSTDDSLTASRTAVHELVSGSGVTHEDMKEPLLPQSGSDH